MSISDYASPSRSMVRGKAERAITAISFYIMDKGDQSINGTLCNPPSFIVVLQASSSEVEPREPDALLVGQLAVTLEHVDLRLLARRLLGSGFLVGGSCRRSSAAARTSAERFEGVSEGRSTVRALRRGGAGLLREREPRGVLLLLNDEKLFHQVVDAASDGDGLERNRLGGHLPEMRA